MAEPKIVSAKAVEVAVHRVTATTLKGEPFALPEWPEGRVARSEDVEAAFDSFDRKLAKHLGKIPAKVSDDVAVQETLQQIIDEAIAGHVANTASTMEALRRDAQE